MKITFYFQNAVKKVPRSKKRKKISMTFLAQEHLQNSRLTLSDNTRFGERPG